LGAGVVKIERPEGGDRLRQRPAMFEAENRGKRSLAIDLKSERGRDVVLRLVADADVVVEGYRPGVMDRLGLGFTHLQAVNRRLIYVSISGYGASGPYRDLPGHDFQYLSYVGAIPAPPSHTVASYVPTSLPIADLGTSLYATMAIVLALYERQRDRELFSAKHIDVAIADCALAMMEPRLAEALTVPTATAALARPGYGIYQAADGRCVTIGALEDHFWKHLVTALELPELLAEQYATFSQRRLHVPAIEAVLRPRIATFERDELVALLVKHDVPVAPLNDLHEPVRDQHFISRRMVVESDRTPTVRIAEWPVALNSFTDRARLTPAPEVGEHSGDVLAGAGLSASEIEDLITAGIVREHLSTVD
jgi:crotonobetainyl-CoA:carnitine CoA-transferase CaiB-like acyl-CoA transferase